MTGKSCFNCKHFEIRDNFFTSIEIRDNFFTSTGQKGFITDLKKCGWKYMVYKDTKVNREFFSNIYCNKWELK